MFVEVTFKKDLGLLRKECGIYYWELFKFALTISSKYCDNLGNLHEFRARDEQY